MGEAGTIDRSLFARLAGGDGDRLFVLAGHAVRWVTYATALLAAGAGVFAVRVLRPAGVETGGVVRLARGSAAVAATALLIGVAVHSAAVSGAGAAGLYRPALLADTAASSVGLEAAVVAAGCAALWAALRRPPGVPVVMAALLVVSGFLAAGHTRTTGPAAVVGAADLVHLAAAAVWSRCWWCCGNSGSPTS